MTRKDYGQAYERGFEATVRLLLARGVPSDAAVDAAQAAWGKGWARLAQLRNDQGVQFWVNSIAFNEYRQWLRRGLSPKREVPLDMAEEGVETGIDRKIDQGIDSGRALEAAIDVRRILALCRQKDRVILVLWMQGFDAEEIGKTLGVGRGAAKSRIFRAIHDAQILARAQVN